MSKKYLIFIVLSLNLLMSNLYATVPTLDHFKEMSLSFDRSMESVFCSQQTLTLCSMSSVIPTMMPPFKPRRKAHKNIRFSDFASAYALQQSIRVEDFEDEMDEENELRGFLCDEDFRALSGHACADLTMVEAFYPSPQISGQKEDSLEHILFTNDPGSIRPRDSSYLMTVVLDLDGTLINSSTYPYAIYVRPDAKLFLEYLSYLEKVEIIIWTSAKKEHLINSLKAIMSPSRYFRIDHVIYRGPSWESPKNQYLKNLKLLNRTNVVLIENTAEIARTCRGNAILLEDFQGDSSDRALSDLGKVVENLFSVALDPVFGSSDDYILLTFQSGKFKSDISRYQMGFMTSED